MDSVNGHLRFPWMLVTIENCIKGHLTSSVVKEGRIYSSINRVRKQDNFTIHINNKQRILSL